MLPAGLARRRGANYLRNQPFVSSATATRLKLLQVRSSAFHPPQLTVGCCINGFLTCGGRERQADRCGSEAWLLTMLLACSYVALQERWLQPSLVLLDVGMATELTGDDQVRQGGSYRVAASYPRGGKLSRDRSLEASRAYSQRLLPHPVQTNMVGLFRSFAKMDGRACANWTLAFSGEVKR